MRSMAAASPSKPGAEDAVGDVELDLAGGERAQRLRQLGEGPAAVADVVDDQDVAVAERLAVHHRAGDGAGVRCFVSSSACTSAAPASRAQPAARFTAPWSGATITSRGPTTLAAKSLAGRWRTRSSRASDTSLWASPHLDRAIALGVQQPARHRGGQRLAGIGHAVLPGVGQVRAQEGRWRGRGSGGAPRR